MLDKINFIESKLLIDELVSKQCSTGLSSSITKFVCCFNLFECFMCENKIEHWYNFHKKYEINKEFLIKEYDFFHNRYFSNEEGKCLFNDLCKYVDVKYKTLLYNNLNNNIDIIYSLLSICYYFRNNLYHGHKSLCELDDYQECFENISAFLLNIIEHGHKINDKENN